MKIYSIKDLPIRNSFHRQTQPYSEKELQAFFDKNVRKRDPNFDLDGYVYTRPNTELKMYAHTPIYKTTPVSPRMEELAQKSIDKSDFNIELFLHEKKI